MNKILTSDDKRFLRFLCRYLGSYGLTKGEIEFEVEQFQDDDWESQIDDIYAFNGSGKNIVEVPEKYKEILSKVMGHVQDKKNDKVSDFHINYEIWEITVDCESSVMYVSYNFIYVYSNDVKLVFNIDNSEEESKMIFKNLEKIKGDNILFLKYEGRDGDRELDDLFTNDKPVPSIVLDWCLETLDDTFPMWDSDLGAKGVFSFDINKKEIVLNHREYDEENDSIKLWSEKF